MGGKGPGHKSQRAWEARQRNIRKARAARKREPLPWRSGLESRVIEQLIWQWWLSVEPRKWPAYRVARFLGVSHTWVNKLVKRFQADPDRMRRRMRAFAPANLEKLERARQETRWQRQHGWLRGPIRARRVKFSLQGKQRAILAETESEKRRRAAKALASSRQPIQPPSSSRHPHTHPPVSSSQPHTHSPAPPPFTDLPLWARGIIAPRN
ncbi:MAG TPA: hypothetical protein VKS44_06260 [Candidatus Acidoferrales bacterium]|nr:hypothetical protein [Candidatus Acidoferrales bacterium]